MTHLTEELTAITTARTQSVANEVIISINLICMTLADVWRGLANLMGGGDSLALGGNSSSDGVIIKTLLFSEAQTM